MKKRAFISLAGVFGLVVAGIAVGSSSAQASGTGAVTTDATGIARGSVLPAFSVTVGFTPENTISGAAFNIFDTWGVNPKYQTRGGGVPLDAAGVCGIESMSDGNNVSLPFDGTYMCQYKADGSSSYSNHIIVFPDDTNAAITVTQPLTVRFVAGVFTAPTSSAATTPWRVLASNDDVGSTGVTQLNFNLIDAVTTPEEQSISCPIGDPIESLPLTTTGMDGSVEYRFTDDPPTGVIIDPVTGVVSGTPEIQIEPTTWLISVTSSTGEIGSATIKVNQPDPEPLPDTGNDQTSLTGYATGALLGGSLLLAIVGVARRRRRH